MTQKKKKGILHGSAACVLLLLTSCASNAYVDSYSPRFDLEYVTNSSDEPVLFEEGDGKILRYLQDHEDYVVIGISSFYDLWAPRALAVNCAKKHGASVVVLAHQQIETKRNTLAIDVPTDKTAYHRDADYGPYRDYVSFTGTSTVYGTKLTNIHYTDTYYLQYAFFLAKRKYINSFGIYFALPEKVPGFHDEAIRVSYVKPGSPAGKQGIKPGDTVKKINGIPIRNSEDVLPFMQNRSVIHSVEVIHE